MVIMEDKMEITILYMDHIGVMQGLRGYIEVLLGLYRDNGKENGSYYLGFRVQGLWILELFRV